MGVQEVGTGLMTLQREGGAAPVSKKIWKKQTAEYITSKTNRGGRIIVRDTYRW